MLEFSPKDYIPEYMVHSPLENLWIATCIVESSNNPRIINEEEQAYGIAQIRQIRLDDYNKRTGANYVLEDCFNPAIAKKIYMYYATTHYSEHDLCMIARKWNGSGPMTWAYWDKIKAELDKLDTYYVYA